MGKDQGYDYWLYDQDYEKHEDFFIYVNSYLISSKNKINVLLVHSEYPLISELSDWIPKNFDVDVNGSNDTFTMKVSKIFETFDKTKHREETIRARILKYNNYPIYMIFSNCSKLQFKTIITALINKHYPSISRMFLTNHEIKEICNELERKTRNEIVIDFSHVKKRLFGTKKKRTSQMTYTDEHYSSIFEKIYIANQWIESIRFEAKVVSDEVDGRISQPKYLGVISRGCFFSGELRFSPFIDIIIPLAVKYAYGKNEYLNVRSKKAKEENPEPIVINFNEDIFEDISENKNFVDSFLDLEKVSVSSYHSNPYIHISLLDYLDGSSYDLWVVSNNRLIIYPQFSASTASMNRILNHIFERIKDGVIEEYKDIVI